MLDESDGSKGNSGLLKAWRSQDVQVLARTFEMTVRTNVKKRSSQQSGRKANSTSLLMGLRHFRFAFPHATDTMPPVVVKAAFSKFDEDSSGKIDFREFCVGVAVCSIAERDVKAGFVFDIFDTSKSGRLNDRELATLFRTAYTVDTKFSDSAETMPLSPTSSSETFRDSVPVETEESIQRLIAELLSSKTRLSVDAGDAPHITVASGEAATGEKTPTSLSRDEFVAWAVPNFNVALLLRPFQIIVPSREEKERVGFLVRVHRKLMLQLQASMRKDGDHAAEDAPSTPVALYLIARAWWDQWCAYSNFKVQDRRIVNESPRQGSFSDIGGGGKPHSATEANVFELPVQTQRERSLSMGYYDRPGPIENSGIENAAMGIETANLLLQYQTGENSSIPSATISLGLTPGESFVAVPASVWDQLWLWYGGGPPLSAMAISPTDKLHAWLSALPDAADCCGADQKGDKEPQPSAHSGKRELVSSIGFDLGAQQLLSQNGFCVGVDGVTVAQVYSVHFTVHAVCPFSGRVLFECPGLSVHCDAGYSSMTVLFHKICTAFRVSPKLARLLVETADVKHGHKLSKSEVKACQREHVFVNDFTLIPPNLYRGNRRGAGTATTVLQASFQCRYLTSGAILALEIVAPPPAPCPSLCVTGGSVPLPPGLEVEFAYSEHTAAVTKEKPEGVSPAVPNENGDEAGSHDSNRAVHAIEGHAKASVSGILKVLRTTIDDREPVEILKGTIVKWARETGTYTVAVQTRGSYVGETKTVLVNEVTYPAIRAILPHHRDDPPHDPFRQSQVIEEREAAGCQEKVVQCAATDDEGVTLVDPFHWPKDILEATLPGKLAPATKSSNGLKHRPSGSGNPHVVYGIGVYEQVEVMLTVPSAEEDSHNPPSQDWFLATIVAASTFRSTEVSTHPDLVQLRVNFGRFHSPVGHACDCWVVVNKKDPFSKTPVGINEGKHENHVAGHRIVATVQANGTANVPLVCTCLAPPGTHTTVLGSGEIVPQVEASAEDRSNSLQSHTASSLVAFVLLCEAILF